MFLFNGRTILYVKILQQVVYPGYVIYSVINTLKCIVLGIIFVLFDKPWMIIK